MIIIEKTRLKMNGSCLIYRIIAYFFTIDSGLGRRKQEWTALKDVFFADQAATSQ